MFENDIFGLYKIRKVISVILVTLLFLVIVSNANVTIQVERKEYSSDTTTKEDGFPNRTFAIDYENDTFTMDGEPFQYVGGSLHYFRSPHQYWRDRLRTLRSAGLNVVSTYVEWSFHEPEKGQYKWTGDHDLLKFIQIAQEENLYVILRPGPYICAERDMGGFPYWLLSYFPNIKLRTNDEDYKSEVTKWYTELMSRVQPLLYGNGGPIIMVQVENEYGSFPACDKEYMSWLAVLTRSWVQDAAVLFTTDGPGLNMLRCGSTPRVYATVDFGTGQSMTEAWLMMRMFSEKGPLVNSEFYPGWLTHWGEQVARVETSKITAYVDLMLMEKANVNFYMFHGGTNFDYTAGSNLGSIYTPDITSYDYDAPMTEAGDPTLKYSAILNVILKYMPRPPHPPPAVRPKGSFSPVLLQPTLALLSAEGRLRLGRTASRWAAPPTMEAILQRSGLTLYEALLPARRPDPAPLTVSGLRDRALVYIDGEFVGGLSRTRKLFTLPVLADQGNFVQILVENQGRVNYGALVNDFKGIIGNVTIGSTVIENWLVTSFPLETVDINQRFRNALKTRSGRAVPTEGLLRAGPVLYTAKFALKPDEETWDTYLDVSGWGKGFAWVNDHHLGRYWPSEGPQVTLYTPGVYLKKYPEENTIVLLEMQKAPANPTIKFIDHHIGV